MSNELEPYIAKGLNEEEAKAVQNYKDRGMPGVSKLKAEAFLSLFTMGYSCQDICAQFPEYELGLLLYARVKFNWDQKRTEYQANLSKQTGSAMVLAKAEAIRFLFDVLSATHVKNRTEIMQYLANPEREKAPEFLPKTLHGYQSLVSMIQDLITPAVTKGSSEGIGANATPLVSVTVNQGTSDKPAIEIKQSDAKSALLEKVGKKKA